MGNTFKLPCTKRNEVIEQVKDTSATAQTSPVSRTASNASSPLSQASEDLGRTLHIQTTTHRALLPRRPTKTVSFDLEKNQIFKIPRESKTDLLVLELKLKKIDIDQSLMYRLERIKAWTNPEPAIRTRKASILVANSLKERIHAAINELESISTFKLVKKNHSLMSEIGEISNDVNEYIANSTR